jgi:ADP-ribosylglycohydrolase
MRAPILGVVYANSPQTLDDAVTRSAVITHAHPLAIEGALIVARATAAAALGANMRRHLERAADTSRSAPFQQRLRVASTWLSDGANIPSQQVRDQLGNGIAAIDSCVTALYLAISRLDSPFMTLHEDAVALGGDVDTISAMAGAIWGARRGGAALPAGPLEALEDRERLERLASALSGVLGSCTDGDGAHSRAETT